MPNCPYINFTSALILNLLKMSLSNPFWNFVEHYLVLVDFFACLNVSLFASQKVLFLFSINCGLFGSVSSFRFMLVSFQCLCLEVVVGNGDAYIDLSFYI